MTLPLPFEVALAPLTNLQRWVTYETYPDEDRPGKTIKRPTDVRTGLWCKVTDQTKHYSYAEAVATGRPVGFVFVEGDGFWFLDIDGALIDTSCGQQWSPLAVALCERFPLAAVEVSQSGKGLHIIGRGLAPPHACKDVPNGLEFYTDGRFVALTGTQLRGDAGADYSAALPALVAEYFPHNPHGEISGWRDQPVDDFGGPTDDAELLRAALASGKRSAAVAFGSNAVIFADLWEANADVLAQRWPGNTNGYDASQADAALAGHLAFWTGKNHERIRDLMWQSALARQKWEDRPDWLEMTIMRAASVVQNVAKGRLAPTPNEEGKTPIIMRAGELDRIATEGEHALIAAGMPIYQRGGLVVPVIDDVAASGGHKTKVARLAPVTIPAMQDYLCRSALFVKYNAAQKMMTANPPDQIAKIILSRDGQWTFSHLAAVITAPTMRPDGSLLVEPGYDPQTRLLLIAPPAMPAIANNPTKQDAMTALARLNGLLCDFPFADDASRAVALSALITPVVRGAISVAPLHAFTAPTPGSGKTYLTDIVAALLMGDRAPVLSVAAKAEETEKRLAGAVLDGCPIVVLDNVNGDLNSDFLCQAVERPRVKIRPLGTSQLTLVECRATFFATGNNLRLIGDMGRRTIICTLDPALERPELRSFDRDPLGMVLANRGEYLAAALTIVRAFVAAGYPGKAAPLGSFGLWSDLVRSALIWLGCADPVATQEAARADDPVITELSALLSEWHEVADSQPFTAKEIIEKVGPLATPGDVSHVQLRDALLAVASDIRRDVDPLRLGKYLGKHRGRIVAGLRIDAVPDAKRKQNRWRVVKVV